MDDQLRGLAFRLGCAKADLLRYFIKQGMTSLAEYHGQDWWSWNDEVVEQVAHAVQAGGASESVRKGILRDIARMGGEVPEYTSEPPSASV
jgi:hypothetical protein